MAMDCNVDKPMYDADLVFLMRPVTALDAILVTNEYCIKLILRSRVPSYLVASDFCYSACSNHVSLYCYSSLYSNGPQKINILHGKILYLPILLKESHCDISQSEADQCVLIPFHTSAGWTFAHIPILSKANLYSFSW